MAPEYGATMGFFPVDEETLRYLRFSGRGPHAVDLVRAYCVEQGLFHSHDTPAPSFSATLELDLATVEPSLAGPKRPQDRVPLSRSRPVYRQALVEMVQGGATLHPPNVTRWLNEGGSPAVLPEALLDPGLGKLGAHAEVKANGAEYKLTHGAVVIAAITSCTNTSNPAVMLGAGLVAKNAVERGLHVKPWVKTSLAPGSRVVTEYLKAARLTDALDALGFNLVGYGCTTCIGNSGPVPDEVAEAITAQDLVVAAVLSGNRNFEGRINSLVRMNYLASPMLVVAYALAGHMDIDLQTQPLGTGKDGQPVYLKDIWPTTAQIHEAIAHAVKPEQFQSEYGKVFEGDSDWQGLQVPTGQTFDWASDSTYVRNPPFFDQLGQLGAELPPLHDIKGARCLALLGDLGHHRSHFAGRLDRQKIAGRQIPRRARRGSRRLQLVWRAPRQPRGHDARHVRQHPHQELDAARRRGRRDGAPGQGRGEDGRAGLHLRCCDAI